MRTRSRHKLVLSQLVKHNAHLNVSRAKHNRFAIHPLLSPSSPLVMMFPHILQLIKLKEMEILQVDASINEMERFQTINGGQLPADAAELRSALRTAKASRTNLLGQLKQLNKECVEAFCPPPSADERRLLA